MAQRVIVQFLTFQARDAWASKQNIEAMRLYKRNPWLSAELTQDQVQQLEQQAEIKISLDVQMRTAISAR